MAHAWGQEYKSFQGIALKCVKVHIHKFFAIMFHNKKIFFKH